MARVIWIDPNIEKTIAHLAGVRATVFGEANHYGARASAILAAHKEEARSFINVTRGTKRVDAYVNLNDTPSKSSQGMPRAHIIEFGREGATPVAPLQKAFGINIKGRNS
jgi:hypothetical protein